VVLFPGTGQDGFFLLRFVFFSGSASVPLFCWFASGASGGLVRLGRVFVRFLPASRTHAPAAMGVDLCSAGYFGSFFSGPVDASFFLLRIPFFLSSIT